MLDFRDLVDPWILVPMAVLLLLHSLFLKGACNAFNRAVDDNPSARIEPPSFLRSLAILTIMFSFIVLVNWGMSTGIRHLNKEHFEPLMPYVPTKHEGEPFRTLDQVFHISVAALWSISGLLQYVFCALLLMYGFNVRYRQANVIAFLFAQRAVIFSTILALLLTIGLAGFFQRNKIEPKPKPKPKSESKTSATKDSGSSSRAADSVPD